MGTQSETRRFQIFDLTPVDEVIIQEKANQIIASVPNEVNNEYNNGCIGFDHSKKCPTLLDNSSSCILDMADEALLQKRRLGMLFLLKNCAKNPPNANGLNTLEGMAQVSCIYDLTYDPDPILYHHVNMDIAKSIYPGVTDHIRIQTR